MITRLKQFRTKSEAESYANAMDLSESQYLPCEVGGKSVFLCGSQELYMDPLLSTCDSTYRSAELPTEPFNTLCDLFSHGNTNDLDRLDEINPQLRKDLHSIVTDICNNNAFKQSDAKEIYAEQIVKIYEQTTDCKIMVVNTQGC